MTGMRLWMEAIKLFGAVVMMVADCTALPSGLCQVSHKPAKANGFPLFKRIKCGTFVFVPGWDFHS
jgi:hypothetical protein